MYNTNVSVRAVVEAVEILWKRRKFLWKYTVYFRGCRFQLFVGATWKAFTKVFFRESFGGSFR